MEKDVNGTPSELVLSHKWEICRHNALHHALLGIAFGAAALPLRRKTATRIGFMALGGGVGIGISLSECNNTFLQHTFYDPDKILLRPAFQEHKGRFATATQEQNPHQEGTEHKAEDSREHELFTEKEQDTNAREKS